MNELSVPLYFTVDDSEYIGDSLYQYEVSCRVVGAARSEVVAVVQADNDGHAVVGEYLAFGELGLPVRVLDRLILLCFRLLRHEVRRADGSAGEWQMTNATRWINCQLGEDAPMVLHALRRHVRSESCQKAFNIVTVRDA
ncbi:hypothetical protein BH09PLA1_BH09PLA1_18350 [soil metagenome]